MRNTPTIVLVKVRGKRHIAIAQGSYSPQCRHELYQFTRVPLMTRDEVILDLEQRLQGEVKHG